MNLNHYRKTSLILSEDELPPAPAANLPPRPGCSMSCTNVCTSNHQTHNRHAPKRNHTPPPHGYRTHNAGDARACPPQTLHRRRCADIVSCFGPRCGRIPVCVCAQIIYGRVLGPVLVGILLHTSGFNNDFHRLVFRTDQVAPHTLRSTRADSS